jgi:serine/threonine protein kinase
MDIKSMNILVRTRSQYRGAEQEACMSQVYISDFGISKAYHTIEDVDTDSATLFTRNYAAPEVAQQRTRGLAADIFSLGCVFLEISATLDDIDTENVLASRVHGGLPYHKLQPGGVGDSTLLGRIDAQLRSQHDASYQNHIEALHDMFGFPTHEANDSQGPHISPLHTILCMIDRVPKRRPTAQDLVRIYPAMACCTTGPETLEAMGDQSEEAVGANAVSSYTT